MDGIYGKIHQNPIEMDDFGVPLFQETSISGAELGLFHHENLMTLILQSLWQYFSDRMPDLTERETWEYMGIHGNRWEYMGIHENTWDMRADDDKV